MLLSTVCLLLHNLRQLEDLILLAVTVCSLHSVSTSDEARLVGGRGRSENDAGVAVLEGEQLRSCSLAAYCENMISFLLREMNT